MTTTKHLRAAISVHDDARNERVGLLNQMSQIEHEIRLAEDWARGATEAHLDTAGRHGLGEATSEELFSADRNRANAANLLQQNKAALEVLKKRLPEADARVSSARAAQNNMALTLASPLVAKSKAKIERLAAELADEIHRAARLVSFDGGMPHSDRLVHHTGNPAAVLRSKGILIGHDMFDHQLYDGRDEMSGSQLLALLEETAAQ